MSCVGGGGERPPQEDLVRTCNVQPLTANSCSSHGGPKQWAKNLEQKAPLHAPLALRLTVRVRFFSGGRVRADPRRQDQLVPLGCAHTKIMRAWFVSNLLFFGGRVRADPRRQDQLVPMGCANTKIVKPLV